MSDRTSVENYWTDMTKALLLGFVGLAVLLHQTFLQGIGFVPEGASQLMMWVAVAGLVAYAALRQRLTIGYWLSSLTGVLYVAFVAILMAGLLGPVPSGGSLVGLVLGPVAQTLYAVVLVVVSLLALQRRDATAAVSETSSQERTSAQ